MAEKTRTIRYYLAEPLNTDAVGWPSDGNIAKRIREKLARTRQDPYIRMGEFSYIVESHHADPLQVSVSTVRRDNLPNLEREGHTTPLPLPDEENLAEPTHCIFFERNIVGVVRSTMTPGHLKSSAVLSSRVGVDLIFTPILRPEVEALVMNSRAAARLDMRVAGSSFDSAAAAGDPVEGVHRLINQFSGAGTVTIGFAARPEPDRQRLLDFIRRNMGRFSEDKSVLAAKATLIGGDGEQEVVDLLEDQLAHSVTISTDSNTRHPDPAEIRHAITTSFAEQRSVILRAIERRAGGD